MKSLTMMRPFSRAFLLSSLAVGTLSAAPFAFAQSDTGDDAAIAQQQKARRQAAVKDAMLLLQQARQAYSEKKYSDAVDLYRNALTVIPKAPASEKQVTFIKESLSDALIAKAMDYRKVGRTDEAREFLLEAIELAPNNKRAKQELVYTNDPVRTNPALTPEHVGNVHEVQRLLTLAEGQYGLGLYDQAIATYQNVLRIDKYNQAARRGIERCHNRRASYSASARDAFRAKALADVDSLYDMSPPSDLYFEPMDEASRRLRELADQQREAGPADVGEFEQRLSGIILPQVILEDATINDVVDLLRAEIQRDEAQNQDASRRHINVIPYFGTVDSRGYKDIQSKTVTLNLSQISITGLLDILVNQLGISYYFDDKGLVLTYSGKDFGPMIDRTFIVPPHFFDSESTAEEEDEDGGFSSVSVGRVNAKASLEGMGISFPKGSHVRYIPSERIMHVRNTAHNMEQIAELLNVPLSEHRVVVLSVIMVQVSEEQLDDLGFEWMFNARFGDAVYGAGGAAQQAVTGGFDAQVGIGDSGAPHVTDGLRSGSSVLSAGNLDRLISTGSVNEYTPRETSKSPGIFGLRGIWNTADVTVLMRGLAQKKGVDMLQRPQIVFQPDRDEQITFGCVREVFFPSGYEPPEIETVNINFGNINNTNNNNNNGQALAATPAHPTDFTRFGMTDDEMNGFGTIIQVHNAEINADASAVTLSLTSTLNEFEGFVNWGQPIDVALWENNEVKMVRLTDNEILQPMIKRYRMNTKVTVASGSVLVLGGLKEARTVEYEDKVPVLGDLPLVGRLFRSQGKSRSRKAVLYFAKVDIVDPTGRDFQTGKKPDEKLNFSLDDES